MLKSIPSKVRSVLCRRNRYQKKFVFLALAIMAMLVITIVLGNRWQVSHENTGGHVKYSIISSELLDNQVLDHHAADLQLSVNPSSMISQSHQKMSVNQVAPRKPLNSNKEETVIQQECLWVNRTKDEPPYFLTALVLLRITKESEKRSNLTTREMKQWLEYLRYAGVEHVYLYDAFVTEDEAQKDKLEPFFQDKFITYVDWHEHNPYTIPMQIKGYQDCLDRFGSESTWQTALDIDEYPFSPSDTEPGFLARFVKNYSAKNPEVSEICMQNFPFLGKPISKSERELLFERLWRRDPAPSHRLVKPIYKPVDVKAAIHHNQLIRGKSRDAPVDELRTNLYWGARLQNWGEDTPEILARTMEDHSMESIVRAFKNCEKYVHPYL